MDLTPGEKTMLRQIRALYAIDGQHKLQVKALLMQWPPIHHDTTSGPTQDWSPSF